MTHWVKTIKGGAKISWALWLKIEGNHDDAAGLEAPADLYENLNIMPWEL